MSDFLSWIVWQYKILLRNYEIQNMSTGISNEFENSSQTLKVLWWSSSKDVIAGFPSCWNNPGLQGAHIIFTWIHYCKVLIWRANRISKAFLNHGTLKTVDMEKMCHWRDIDKIRLYLLYLFLSFGQYWGFSTADESYPSCAELTEVFPFKGNCLERAGWATFSDV